MTMEEFKAVAAILLMVALSGLAAKIDEAVSRNK